MELKNEETKYLVLHHLFLTTAFFLMLLLAAGVLKGGLLVNNGWQLIPLALVYAINDFGMMWLISLLFLPLLKRKKISLATALLINEGIRMLINAVLYYYLISIYFEGAITLTSKTIVALVVVLTALLRGLILNLRRKL